MKIEEEIKQTKFRNAHHKAMLNIFYTSGWLENKNKEFFLAYGLTPQQFNILRILRGQHPNKISGAEIKARMLDKNSDVSRLLDRLIVKKLAAKTPCPKDRRATNIAITENGLRLLSQLDKKMDQTDIKAMHLTSAEAIQLSNLLDKCRG